MNTHVKRALWFMIVCQTSLTLANIATLHAATKVESYSGMPFGVGKVTVDILRGKAVLPLSDERFTIEEINGRAFYPVMQEERVKNVVRQLLKMDSPRQVTLYFLFQGAEPFEMSVFAPNEQGVRVTPVDDPGRHARLLDEWWGQMTGRLQRLEKDPAYPPVAENFLTANLARRLQKTIPVAKKGLLPWSKTQDSALGELFVTEAYQLQVDRELLSTRPNLEQELLPLPQRETWSQDEELELNEEIAIEPMAVYVPEECFYIRFGNFTNYLWFRDLNKKWQGDIGNMIMRRGILRGSGERTQQQLSLKENALAKILGPQVIADAAIIGMDPYVGQGAAIGILFQAKNNLLLSQDLMRQRRAALGKFASAKEETIKILDQDVSLISTPHGEVRSYYVRQNEFHLVTTSKTLVLRFLEAGSGKGSLASNRSFLKSRQKLPVERQDTVFGFVSSEFFLNLCSPHYRVETERRIRSYRERHLLELSRYAAAVERSPAVSTEEFIDSGMLPQGFGLRADGSVLKETEDGFLDSVRGGPGYYLPVPDVPIESITSEEKANYDRFIKRIRKDVGEFPPIAFGLRRTTREDSAVDTMTLDVSVAGISNSKLGELSDNLGDPTANQLRAIEGDILFVEAALKLALPFSRGEQEAQHLFGALRDFRSPLVVQNGGLLPGDKPSELVRGYLGAWPKPGILKLFVGDSPAPDAQPNEVGEDLWQAKQEEFLVISFKSEVLDQVLPNLTWEPAERPAQVRLRLHDLTNTEMAKNVSAFGYMRSRETSMAASRLMNSLANQLHVPRPECLSVAERLVDGKFDCALGGTYEMYATERGLEVWLSSSLPEQNRFLLTEVPEDFQLPLLDWFRGLRGDAEITDDELRVHLEIDILESALP